MVSREVKDSGIEWIAQVPKDWQLVRLKDGYNFEKGKNSSLYTKEYIGTHPGKYPVYSGQTENDGIMGSIDTYDYELDECLFTTTVGAKVMSPRVLKGRFSLSQNCLIMKSNGIMNNRFVYYTLYPLFDYQKSAIPSYMQPSLRVSDLNKYNFYVPSIHEQKKIAAFLDEKVAHIDNIIENTKKSIENLKAYKQSLITETVTKGLNPNVEMKDSGIEWIGNIPKHWVIYRISQIFREHKEKNVGLIEDNLLSLSYGKVKRRDIKSKEGLLPQSFEGYNIIQPGDIVLRMTDLQNDQKSLRVGLCEEKGIITSAYITIRSYNNIYPHYAYYYLHSFDIYKGFYGMGAGVRQGVNFNELKKLDILFPTYDEQKQITEFLDEKTRTINSTIEQKEQLINDFDSYKKSLIYEYVTGKKEVN